MKQLNSPEFGRRSGPRRTSAGQPSLSVGQFRAAILGLWFLAYAENRFDEVDQVRET